MMEYKNISNENIDKKESKHRKYTVDITKHTTWYIRKVKAIKCTMYQDGAAFIVAKMARITVTVNHCQDILLICYGYYSHKKTVFCFL